MTFTATFDACVLHPAGLRDLLIRLAMTGMFRAVWSDRILDEMVHSILRRRADLTPDQLDRTRQLMCAAVPDCLVSGYDSLIEELELPDKDDRHVLAVAIRSGSQIIVTENLRDFPTWALDPYGIEAQDPDTFVLELLGFAPKAVAEIVEQQASALRDPPMTVADLHDHLAQAGLRRSVTLLRSL